MTRSLFRLACGLAVAAAALFAGPAGAQTTTPAATQPMAVGGVAISPDGVLQMRRTVPPQARRTAETGLTYISLARVFTQMAAAGQGGSLPPDLRYLHGLTRIDYLFVYPDQHDLVLAGPSEAVNADNPLQPVGRATGRPVVQAEDLIVALRAVGAGQGAGAGGKASFFGCSLDMVPDAQQIATDVGRRFAGASRARLAEELKAALGPQQVRILGVPEDSRLALAMVAADYRLKRMCIGLDAVPGVGNALGAGLASNRLWFEPAYEPLGVSADGLSYHLAGPRLKVLAGPQEFKPDGATPAAAAFAKRFSEKMPEAAARIDALADLQNVADVFMVAALIRHDRLAEKAGVDLAAVLAPDRYRVASLPVPRTAETMVSDNGSMIAQGGVAMAYGAFADVARDSQGGETLTAARDRPIDTWFLTKAKAK
jgi:hypothetical protein